MKSKFGDDLLPNQRATLNSAGYDIRTPVPLSIMPMNYGVAGYTVIDTGIYLEKGDLKPDQVLLILPRSSYGFKYGMAFANTMPVIDADYVGPENTIKLAIKVDHDILTAKRGDRIAQGIILNYGTFKDEVPPTEERKGGVGSTGV